MSENITTTVAASDDRPEWRIKPTIAGTFNLARWEFSHATTSLLGFTRAHHEWKSVGIFETAEAAREHIEAVKRIEAMPVEYVR